MNSLRIYLKSFVQSIVIVIVFSFVGCFPVSAVTLNFSAYLVNGTCTLNLDKSTLPLGTMLKNQLRPERIVKPQPFTLNVTNCVGTMVKPQIRIRGEGILQDNKWLFRSAAISNVKGAGILVIRSNTTPSYSEPEVKDGDLIPLNLVSGVIPQDQAFTFYAGVSCGSNTGCSDVNTGNISATLMFDLTYQ